MLSPRYSPWLDYYQLDAPGSYLDGNRECGQEGALLMVTLFSAVANTADKGVGLRDAS